MHFEVASRVWVESQVSLACQTIESIFHELQPSEVGAIIASLLQNENVVSLLSELRGAVDAA